MKLYHGTNHDFHQINLAKSLPYKDFGRGFYLTDLEPQARRMAMRKASAFGGTPVVQQYQFDESRQTDGSLDVLQFEMPTIEWARFIFGNRSRETHFTHQYDIVIGPIADDGVAFLINQYQSGAITIAQFARMLKYRKLSRQYYFGTARAIKLLERI
ncbi:MAG: DUF3990 domain-containing protein [Prevotella sp.]|nr:DUF3990 domain-containing protein [Prevotella sp.]